MFKSIKEIFQNYQFFNPLDLFALTSIAKFKKLEKGEHIIKVGDLNFNGIIVIKGLLSHYIIDDEGNEKTLLFIAEKMTTGSLNVQFFNKPADENILALETSYLVMFDTREINKLATNNIHIMRMLNDKYKEIICNAAERLKYYSIYSPEQRYINFCKQYPNLEQRIKQKHLASYLGITTTSLSRLRARLGRS